MTAFVGGKFEASGVAAVPGSDGVLFVDNNQAGQVFWMRLDGDGKQVGAIKAVELGVRTGDLEGITTDGTYFYVISSQSNSKANDTAGLVGTGPGPSAPLMLSRWKFSPRSTKAHHINLMVAVAVTLKR